MEQRTRPSRRPGLTLGRIFGVPLRVDASMLLLTVVVTVLYAALARRQLDLGHLGGYLVGLGFVVSLLGSVLLHELGHALTARRYGIGVRGITLELLGGYTEMDRDAPSPKVDLLVSLAGPAVSAVLGAGAVAATLALPAGTLAHQLAFQLAVSNVVVAVFNSLPGLPLDGGRALRAAVWAVTRDRHRGTEVAGWIGRAVAVATVALVVLLTLRRALAPLALPAGTLAHQLAFQLAVSNVVVAVFNSLPGLPLDGGRALRAAVWAVTRDRHRGTEVAGWIGRAVAVATVALVVLLTVRRALAPLALPLMLLVAFTLWRGAGQSIRMARISRRLPLVDLSRLARPLIPVPSGTPLAEAQRRRGEGATPYAALTVVDSAGRPVALVDPARVAAVPLERRPWVAVDAVSRDLGSVPALPVGADGERVMETVRSHPGAQYVVTAGEDVVGVLHIADLAQLLEPKRKTNT